LIQGNKTLVEVSEGIVGISVNCIKTVTETGEIFTEPVRALVNHINAPTELADFLFESGKAPTETVGASFNNIKTATKIINGIIEAVMGLYSGIETLVEPSYCMVNSIKSSSKFNDHLGDVWISINGIETQP
jgi:hypothetical protein